MPTQPWIRKIDENTARFVEEFGGLNAQQLNWKPSPTNWSIAQNLHHLIVINRTYFPIIEALKKGKYTVPALGKVGFLARFLGNFILQSVSPDRRKKISTFPIWEPATSELPADILSQFVAHQEELKQEIEKCKNLIHKGIVISSPANRNIVYPLETAFDIILTHELRHLEQAKEVWARQQNLY